MIFLHLNLVGAKNGFTVNNNVKGKCRWVIFSDPRAQKNYVKNYNDEDKIYQYSAKNTTTFRTNNWYLRIFLGIGLIFAKIFVTFLFIVKVIIGNP